MLKMDHINTFYGKVRVLWDLTLKIDEKEIVALVGAMERVKRRPFIRLPVWSIRLRVVWSSSVRK